jgi:hypothetical protein
MAIIVLTERSVQGYPWITNELPRSKLRDIECHSVLDTACPVLDTGESSPFLWIPAGVYPALEAGPE